MNARAFDTQVSRLVGYSRANSLAALAWAVGLYLAFLFIGFDWARALTSDALLVAPNTVLGRDFANVYAGGHLVRDGELGVLYDLGAYQTYQNTLFAGAVNGHNYSYSPVSFLYVWLFSLVPYFVAYLLWTVLTGLAFVLAARPYLRDVGLPAWLALLVPAALINIWAGHYGFLIGALWLGAWHLLQHRPRMAGVLVGLMIVKPHLAILMPLLLIRRGAWTPFLFAALTSAGLILLSILLFGIQPWVDYLTRTVGLQASLVDDVGQFFMLMMPTIAPGLFRVGLPDGAVWAIQLAGALAATGGLLWKMPADARQAGLAGACATFLVLPYAFNYDMTAVSIAALVMLRRASPDSGWTRSPALAACAFLLPVAVMAMNQVVPFLAPMILAAMLAALLAPSSSQDAGDRQAG